MGGFGSGVWRDRGAGRCEHYRRIDLAYLNRHKLVGRSVISGTLRWTRGHERTGSVNYTVTSDKFHLSYRTRAYGEEDWQSVEEDIWFDWTDTAFGGRRRWFICPSCCRRCRILYGGSLLRCRKCYRLTYESQYEPAWGRAISRAQKIRERLGGSGSMDEGFPPKPKGMHWKTYRRLEAQDEAADQQFAVLLAGWMKQGILG